MKKTIEVYTCDICKQEKKTISVTVLTYRTFDDTDGLDYYAEPQYANEKADVCADCLKKIAVIWDIGVQCVNLQYNPPRPVEG